MPLYPFIPSKISEALKFVKETYVNLGWRKQYCGIFEINYNGLPMYFIENKFYFGGDKLYYKMEDDIERFAFFSAAVMEALPHLNFAPDVIHCHDWHVSLIPVLLHARYKKMQFYGGIKTVMTIHNLKYQGICNKYKLHDIIGINDGYSVSDCLSYGDNLANCLKGGISVADKLTTVSETYAREVRSPYYGEGLDWLLNWRGHDLVGIVNGIDYRAYDPALDGSISERYSAGDAARAKKINKSALRTELGLRGDAGRPLVAVITRLVEQKGIDLIIRVFDEIMALSPQFVLIGTGDKRYEDFFRSKGEEYPDDAAIRITFDENLARRVYAGADFLLMPSVFEPCGISQLIAMRYGALPIVRETGGLADTVTPYNEAAGAGNGYSFTNINAHDMLHTINYALGVYRNDPDAHNNIINEAMSGDNSWDLSAKKYKELYRYM